MGLLIHITGESVFLNVGLEKQGDQVARENTVKELQSLPQHFLGRQHLAHIEIDLQGKEGQ